MHQHQQHPMLDRQGDLPENEGPDDLKEAASKILAITRAQAQQQQTDL